MFVINDETNETIDNITILLSQIEIQQLLGYAKQLLEIPAASDHYHLSSDDYQKEITITLYDPTNIKNLNPIIQRLINTNDDKT